MTEVIRFTATWCGPCKVLAPLFQQLSEEFGGKASFRTVDVDQESDFATQNKVSSIPTIIIFKNGKEVQRHIGVKPKATYISNLSAIL